MVAIVCLAIVGCSDDDGSEFSIVGGWNSEDQIEVFYFSAVDNKCTVRADYGSAGKLESEYKYYVKGNRVEIRYIATGGIVYYGTIDGEAIYMNCDWDSEWVGPAKYTRF